MSPSVAQGPLSLAKTLLCEDQEPPGWSLPRGASHLQPTVTSASHSPTELAGWVTCQQPTAVGLDEQKGLCRLPEHLGFIFGNTAERDPVVFTLQRSESKAFKMVLAGDKDADGHPAVTMSRDGLECPGVGGCELWLSKGKVTAPYRKISLFNDISLLTTRKHAYSSLTSFTHSCTQSLFSICRHKAQRE